MLEETAERLLSRLTEVSIDSGDAISTITINDYSALALDTVTVTIDATANVLTEGTDWNRGASNAAAATSLAAAIDALTGVSASATAAVVTITAPENITSLAVSDAVNMTLLDSSLTTIVDTTKNWGTDMWKDAIVEVEVDDVHYYRVVTSNTATTLTIATLPAGYPVAVGSHYNIRLSTRTVQISGQMVQVASGLHVMVSGQMVQIASGPHVLVSGQQVVAKVSGETVTVASGPHVLVSGQQVVAKVSGETVTVASGPHVLVSGQQVVAKVSGETVTVASGPHVMVSGQMVQVASGPHVLVSGQQVIAKVSGETVDIEAPTAVKTGAILHPTAASGGTIVTSGAVKAATFKALSGEVYLGGSVAGQMPYSNYGFLLAAGEAASLDIDEFGRVRIYGVTSGSAVSYIGVK